MRSQWESRFNFGGEQPQNQGMNTFNEQSAQQTQLPPEVSRELNEMRSFIGQYKAEQQAKMQAEQDAELASEICFTIR